MALQHFHFKWRGIRLSKLYRNINFAYWMEFYDQVRMCLAGVAKPRRQIIVLLGWWSLHISWDVRITWQIQ